MIAYARQPHYAAHLQPVAARIADLDVTLAASYQDMREARRAGHERIVLMQHGSGQSYSDDNPHYPGGRDNEGVGLFLVPGEHPAERWRKAYPSARVEVVGSPRLDDLPRRLPGPVTVAVTTHWNDFHVPESRSAFALMAEVLPDLARRFHVIGHGHPRRAGLARKYQRLGIEYVPDFDDVCRRSDVLIGDNTSGLFEFAATGRPVVLYDPPYYRPEVRHGLRFYDAAHVGVRVSDLAALPVAVAEALDDAPERKAAREDALGLVYGYREDATERAVATIRDWAA